jgi:hypothetical protein
MDHQSRSSGQASERAGQPAAVAIPGKRTLTESLPAGPGQRRIDGSESAGDIAGGAGGSGAQADLAAPPVDVEALLASGQPLDGKSRQALEQRFGRSLADVRVHTEVAAVEKMGAAAYTHKNHIAFAPGRYKPESPEGMGLLVHELAHVVQGAGDGAPQAGREVKAGAPDGAHEAEANQLATRSMTDSHLHGGGPAPGSALEAGLPTQEATGAAAHKLGQPAAGWEVSQRADPDRAHRCIGGCTPQAPARPSLATIMADATVSAELTRAWNESNPNVPDAPSGSPTTKVEQGGWILWNPTNSTFTVQRVPAGTRDGLAPIVGTKPADTATAVVVAWFHTHPNTRAEGYGPDPSGGDIGFTQSAQVPGIIKTHEGDRTIPYP